VFFVFAFFLYFSPICDKEFELNKACKTVPKFSATLGKKGHREQKVMFGNALQNLKQKIGQEKCSAGNQEK